VAEQTFTINVVVDPTPAEGASKKVQASLERAGAVADNLRAQIARAYGVGADGARAAAEAVTKALGVTGNQATKTQAAIARALERRTGGSEARKGLEELDRAMGRAANSADNLRDRLSGMGPILARFLSAAGILAGARAVLSYADAYTQVQNRLRTVTDGQTELASVTNRLLGIANDTRQSFESTAELYSRVALSAKELGRTQNQLLDFTESLNQAIVLSGASSQEASAGLIQLSQGLASGALRGDELRSVLEQLPAVADVIAKGLGVTRGELRKLGSEGKISAKAVLDAFAAAREELAERFGKTVPTVGQSLVVFRNNLIATVGAIDQATGATSSLSRVILLASEHMVLLTAAAATLGTAITINLVRGSMPALARASGFLLRLNPFIALTAAAVGLGVAIAGVVGESERATLATQELTEERQKFVELSGREINARFELARIQAVLDKDPGSTAAQDQLEKVLARRTSLRRELTAIEVEGAKRTKADEEATIKATVAYREAVKSLEDEEKLLRLTNSERTIRERVLKIENAIAKEGKAITDDLRAKIEAQVRYNQGLKEENALYEDLVPKQTDYGKQIDLLALSYTTGRRTLDEYNKALAALTSRMLDDLMSTPFAQSLIQLNDSIADLESRASRPFGDVAARAEGRVRDVARAGGFDKMSSDQAEAAKNEIRNLTAREELLSRQAALYEGITGPATEYVATLAAANAQYAKTPELQAELQRSVDVSRLQTLEASTDIGAGFERAFLKAKLEAEDFASVAERAVNVFASAAEDALVEFAETGSVNFKELARGILADLARIIARLLVVQALSAFAGGPAVGAAAGAAGGAAGSFAGGRQHGGTVQPGRTYLVGEGGPEPFTPGRTGTITPNPSTMAIPAPEVTVQVVNVTDKDEVATAISSGAADHAIVNAIGRNAGKVKASLG